LELLPATMRRYKFKGKVNGSFKGIGFGNIFKNVIIYGKRKR